MYLLGTLLTFLLIELNPFRYELIPFYSKLAAGERISVLLLNLTMLKGFFNDYKFTGIAQGWSLTVEECFYLGAPFFMIAIRRSRWALIFLPIIIFMFMLLLLFTIGSLNFHGLFTGVKFMLNFTFFGRCLEFFAGIALAVHILRQKNNSSTYVKKFSSLFTFLGSILLIISLLVMASIPDVENSRNSFGGIAWNNFFLPIAVILLLYSILTEQTWLRALLSTKLFDLLGKSSYIFYLIHTGVVNILLRNYLIHNSIVQFILINILSVLLYKYVESPLHLWLKPQKYLTVPREANC